MMSPCAFIASGPMASVCHGSATVPPAPATKTLLSPACQSVYLPSTLPASSMS
ncbi:hypothetical protein QPK32_20640 [Massilia sp. YIM B02763]|uniref:hypothetical protein n=1 Tax=Massilia sp. YIM B02763 TaxID=3050130 RepID=UPI0025B6F233|nr:hypothetical protein [Massilia sp. YIM B02763]MDN4055481.1 hypothetical protein [Massilia sp. YIM B02763]